MTTPEGHRRLILTRHAKSSWDEPGLSDRDRPLNSRGRRAAQELGAWLASRDYLPDEVLSSDAARTRETWAGVAEGLPGAPAAQWLPGLYHAEAQAMLAALRKAAGRTVMMIGHNPGIGEFAALLPAREPADPDFARYPTAATLVVDFEVAGWGDVAPGRGSVMDFFKPSDRGGGG
jgi:phosphohistidine phosphatase